jgi:hypothetical protein
MYFLLFFFGSFPLWIVALLFWGRGWYRYATLCSFVHSLRSFSCVLILFLSYFPFCSWFVALFHLPPYRVVCSSVGADHFKDTLLVNIHKLPKT